MPVERVEQTWPLASIKESYNTYRHDGTFRGLSLRNYATLDLERMSDADPLTAGICVGLCVRWLRSIASKPWQNPMERMTTIEKEFDSAAATHLLYQELHQPRCSLPDRLVVSSESFTAVARASGLTFEPRKEFPCRTGLESYIQFKANAVRNGFHLLEIVDDNKKKHAVSMHYRPQSCTQFFDPNRGEYSIPYERFEQFWNYFCALTISLRKTNISLVRLYSVEYSLPSIRYGPSGIV